MKIAGLGVVVTGGGSGLGAATAEALADAGAKVTVVDMNGEAARGVAQRLNGLAIEGDVTNDEAMALAFETAMAAHGPCRVLVNCAGIGVAKRVVGREGPMPLGDFKRVINVNLIGSFNMMRLAAAQMSKAEPLYEGERGVIISTSSVAAFEGQLGQAAYAASKGGIASLTLPVARELAAFGIRVLTIAPGLFLTPLLQTLPEDVQKSLGASIPFPSRLGLPEEFASLVSHMVENRFLNGETIRLDGALRLPPK
jgi:NAD(P)-dependent dehydrogenase (short-subunit alcohol dehydrogenase family)